MKARDLNMTHSGKTIDVKSGEVLHVSLDVSSTAGYTWILAEKESYVLIKQVGYSSTKSNNKGIGSGGVMTFIFRTQGTGEEKLKLHYLRPWEDKEPQKVFELTVKVT
jgi:predicted secreted protein